MSAHPRGWRRTQPPCPECGRGFADAVSMQQHLNDKHHVIMPAAAALFEKAAERSAEPATFEDALIRIANSTDHDEAVRIATAALLGGTA